MKKPVSFFVFLAGAFIIIVLLALPSFLMRSCKQNASSSENKQEVYIGDIPTMTDKGTFIVNGAERVIVSQIVRSPGVYFKREVSPTGKRLYNATMIPNRGAWLKIETDANDLIYMKIDKNRKRHNYFCLLISLIYSIREEVVNVEEAIGVSSIIFMYWSTT